MTHHLADWHWYVSNRCDPRAVALYLRHYSSEKGGRKASCYRAGFTGPGEDLVLLTAPCDALWAWTHQTVDRMDDETGVNCSVFRNEGDVLSSTLVREADELGWSRWPNEPRHFTYVDPSKVRAKRDPGRCFLRAGWRYTGRVTKRGLRVLEIVR